MTTRNVVDLAEVLPQRDRQAREDRARRDWLHKAVDRILDGPHESLKLSTETILEAFITISEHRATHRFRVS